MLIFFCSASLSLLDVGVVMGVDVDVSSEVLPRLLGVFAVPPLCLAVPFSAASLWFLASLLMISKETNNVMTG